MNTCTKCFQEKPETDFRWKNKAKEQRSYWCKPCYSKYEKEKWKTCSDRRETSVAANRQRRIRNAQYVYDYLLNHPCPCGEPDPAVLDFDHRDKEDKLMNVSDMVRNSRSIKAIQSEMNKCNVLCSNCHRRRTAVQQGWYANLIRV